MSSCDDILSIFFRSYFFKKSIRDTITKQKAAEKIQDAFRKSLYYQRLNQEIEFRAAMKIQISWRANKENIKKRQNNLPPSLLALISPPTSQTTAPAPRSSKKKILVNLLPPYRNKNKNRLTPHDIEVLEEEQKENLKWISKDIMTPQIKKIFNMLTKRDDLVLQNQNYIDRYVSKTFLTYAHHSNESDKNISRSFIHAPTFTIFSVSNDHISRQTINVFEDEIEEFYYDFKATIIDSEMHKLSGRIFCLLSDFSITIFENGYYTQRVKPDLDHPLLHQSKYLHVDKFGYLWIINTSKHSTIYRLDPFCLTLLSKYVIVIPPNRYTIKSFAPIYENNNLKGFFVSCKFNSTLYIVDVHGQIISSFTSHVTYTPKFAINKNYVMTYGNDKKMVLYKRFCDKLTEAQVFQLTSIPTSVIFIQGFKIFAVGLSDCSIRFYTLNNASYSLTLPLQQIPSDMQDVSEDVLGKPLTTQSRLMYSEVMVIRVLSKPLSLSAVQFAPNAALMESHLEDGTILIFWLMKQSSKLKVSDFDKIHYPLTSYNPKYYTRVISETLLSQLSASIEKTRRQFARDALYVHQVGKEFEKRFLSARFNCQDLAWGANILMQSPFKRWTRVLSYLPKNSISIYEVFYFLTHYLVTKFKSVSEMNNYIVSHLKDLKRDHLPNQMIGTIFTKNDLLNTLNLFVNSCCEDIKIYVDAPQKYAFKNAHFSSLLLKRLITQKNKQVIFRLIEIENILKNRIYVKSTRTSLLASLKCPKYTLKIPDIIPEKSMPGYNPKWIRPSQYLMPDPLVERFRYRSCRDLEIDENDILYCSYGTESPYAKVVPLKEHSFPLQEIRITRPLAKMSMTFDLIAISTDSTDYIVQYPVENVPFSYILESCPFRDAKATSILVARYWLSQILMMIACVHKHNIVLRSILPSNLFVSYDGINVQIQSLADALFESDNSDKPLPFKDTVWNPPECYLNQQPTPAFDIFQFGVLMCYMLTGMLPNSFVTVLRNHEKFSSKCKKDILKSENFLYDPFDGLHYHDFPFLTKKGSDLLILIDVESNFSLMEIIRNCMDLNPRKRPTARQLLMHPFFNLAHVLVKRARNFAHTFIKRAPVPLLIDGIFNTLFDKIQDEINDKERYNKSPSLSRAVKIFHYIFNPNEKLDVRIQLPIDEKMKIKIIEEIFNHQLFAKMVSFVIDHLHTRTENEKKFDDDPPFLDIVSLYHKFFISYLDEPSIFVKSFNSFLFLATGLSDKIDSHLLFNFLHSKLSPLVKFFFTKIPPKTQQEFLVSEFYCQHFIEFYDNNREFSEGIVERSEKRCIAVLSFYESFLDLYEREETIQLFHTFNILHKIEICMYFTNPSATLKAMKFSLKLLSSSFSDRTIFDRFSSVLIPSILSSETTSYEHKIAALDITRLLLFSNSLIAMSNLLIINIMDSLLFCTQPRFDRSTTSTHWGCKNDVKISELAFNLLSDICKKGINSMFKRFIYYTNDLSQQLIKLKLIDFNEDKKYLDEVSTILTNNQIPETVYRIIKLAETSSLNSVLTMASCSQNEFENSLQTISMFLLEQRYIDLNLFVSLLKVWNRHNLKINRRLFERIKEDFKHRVPGSLKLVYSTFSILKSIPDFFIELAKTWIDLLKIEYKEIREMIQKHNLSQSIILNYGEDRYDRLNMLSAILKTPDPKLTAFFEMNKSVINLILKNMLPDVNKFNITMKVVPAQFARYNKTYPIRSEALAFIQKIIQERTRNPTFFYYFSKELKQTGVLENEADLLMKVADEEFRRTTIRLLNILDGRDSPFNVSNLILKNRLLMNLKDEELNDWDNFQILRNAFSLDEKPPRIKRLRPLYDSV